MEKNIDIAPLSSSKRRHFMRIGSACLLGGLVPALVHTNVHASAMVAANLAIDMMMRFSSPGGGGIESMLKAQLEYQRIIADKLSDIQRSIADIRLAIDKLPDEMKTLLRAQFRDELMARIAGNAKLYGDYLEQSATTPGVFQMNDVRDHLSFLQQVTASDRSTLSTQTSGPHVALVVPLALGLEVACHYKTGGSKLRLATILNSYERWVLSMISNNSGAINDYIKSSVEAHDKEVDKAAGSRLGAMFNIKAFKIADSQQRQSQIHGCVLVTGFKLAPGHPNPVKLPADTITAFRHAAWQHSVLESVDAADAGVRVIRFTQGDFLAANREQHHLTWPAPLSDCYIESNQSVGEKDNRSREQILDIARPSLAKADAENAALRVHIDKLNYQRMEIGFASKAMVIADNTLAAIRVQKRLNGVA